MSTAKVGRQAVVEALEAVRAGTLALVAGLRDMALRTRVASAAGASDPVVGSCGVARNAASTRSSGRASGVPALAARAASTCR